MEKPITAKIPQTDSIEELAQFWDSHDVTDLESQLKEVSEPVFERETVVSVRLPCEEAESLRKLAVAKGLHDVNLIRQWVLERVHAS